MRSYVWVWVWLWINTCFASLSRCRELERKGEEMSPCSLALFILRVARAWHSFTRSALHLALTLTTLIMLVLAVVTQSALGKIFPPLHSFCIDTGTFKYLCLYVFIPSFSSSAQYFSPIITAAKGTASPRPRQRKSAGHSCGSGRTLKSHWIHAGWPNLCDPSCPIPAGGSRFVHHGNRRVPLCLVHGVCLSSALTV